MEEVNVTSVIGDTVTLPCRTSYSDVDWKHKDTPTSSVYYVYTNGVVYDIFQSRFTVPRQNRGEFDLVISPVQLDDAGLYVCVDDAGLGESIYIYQLSVVRGEYSHVLLSYWCRQATKPPGMQASVFGACPKPG